MTNYENEYVDYEEIKDENELVQKAKNDQDFARVFMKLHTPLRVTELPSRNDICPFCDSRKKFKKCECYNTHVKEYRNQYYT